MFANENNNTLNASIDHVLACAVATCNPIFKIDPGVFGGPGLRKYNKQTPKFDFNAGVSDQTRRSTTTLKSPRQQLYTNGPPSMLNLRLAKFRLLEKNASPNARTTNEPTIVNNS